MNRLHMPKGIVIHHSATRDTESISYNAIRKYHVEKMDWDEIGYHYLIEMTKNGVNIFTGRGLQYEGAHTLGRNDMVGICVVGDYDVNAPTNEHIETLVRTLVAQLAMFPKLGIEDIHFHNETAPKTCPGLNFPTLAMIKAWVDVKRKYL